MSRIIVVSIVLTFTNVLAYHDPDLNYHLNQLNKPHDCGPSGYSYPVPPVQLTAAGIRGPPPPAPINYAYSNAGHAGLGYQANLAYSQPAYSQASFVSHPSYSSAYSKQEAHGYSTSAGLSSYASLGRTVIPQATYAQAPIIAKITAAPLIAKYATAPAKNSFVSQNLIAQQAYAAAVAKSSYNAYNEQSGPVVSQVYAAPSAGYAAAGFAANAFRPPVPAPAPVAPAPVRHPNVQVVPAVSQYYAPAPVGPVNHLAPAVQYAPTPLSPFVPPVASPAPSALPHGHVKNAHAEFVENYDAHPMYTYEYSVNDPHTGDIKHQKEQRDGEVVKGQYSLVEPDGSVRTVEYVADWDTGFHANVRNSKDHQ